MHYAVIVAAGSGSRMGENRNKAFLPIAQRPMLAWSLETFDRSACIDKICIVHRAEDKNEVLTITGRAQKDILLVEGGETRQDSVYASLRALPQNTDIVLIHDAARPFISKELVYRTWRSAVERGSGIAALPAKDTIKRANGDAILETLPREDLRIIQTPQAFRYADILAAHESGLAGATDDAALLEAFGKTVYLVDGEESAFKVTTPWDMALAEAIAKGDAL